MEFRIGDRVRVVSTLPRLIEKFGDNEGEVIRFSGDYVEVYFSSLQIDWHYKSCFIFPEHILKKLVKFKKNYRYVI